MAKVSDSQTEQLIMPAVHKLGSSSGFCGCLHQWWYPKLSRFKSGVWIMLLITMVVLATYKLTVFYHNSPLTSHHLASSAYIASPNNNINNSVTPAFSDKIRYKHTKRRFPHCLIIGIRKAGTRALLTYLNQHPHIKTASEEVHFFDDMHNYERGLEWYRKKMPYSFAEEVTLEKSPAYFSTQEVPDRVFHMNSSMKLLLVVREPFDRMVSDYLQITMKKQSKNMETLPLEEMMIKEDNTIDMHYPPLVRSVYYMYMENWLRKFDLSHFHIVDGDRLVKDPFSEMKKVETFLGIEHRIKKENFYFNESRGFYCIRNETRDKCLAESKGRPHPPMDPQIKKRIKEFLVPYNIQFFKLIKRKFPWNDNL